MQFTLYTANCRGKKENCLYSNEVVVKDANTLQAAVQFDHVTAKYKNSYRTAGNFKKADCLVLDCDNDHTDNAAEWIVPESVAKAFSGVSFMAVYSRNNLKAKGKKTARPRFHVYFPIAEIVDSTEYAELKQKIATAYPYFDTNALDAARFIFGTETPKVEVYEGTIDIADYLEEVAFTAWDSKTLEVPEGKRNSTMSHIAGRIIMRFGKTEEAYQTFRKAAEKCKPHLAEKELNSIWQSAKKFGNKVTQEEGYIAPEIYNSQLQLKPDDYSDVGQAVVLAREYGKQLRYSPQTDFIVYNGSFWEESKPKSQKISQELTDRQLEEAEGEIKRAMEEMQKNGAMTILAEVGPKKAVGAFNKEQARTYELYTMANQYRTYGVKRRESKSIAATLKEARPMLEIEQKKLDADDFLLNAPSATHNLKTGEVTVHNSLNFITKQTNVDPSLEGLDLWEEALSTFFCEDKELIDYVQKIVGLSAIGKVYVEALIIAFGEGRNGKSTFWNTVSRVLGSYSGNISADMLTVGCRRNVKPELAEAKGKRLLIAAELEEGMRLNTSNVKQLCSTDEIYAEKKYKDPFSYVPTHTLVLYTNHLPRVGAIDSGTWRRLIVIPFDAKIDGSADVKNYADFLFHNAGGAILAWILEGAKRVIAEKYKFKLPKRVVTAINTYKANNDWMGNFLEDCCEIGDSFMEKSGSLYGEYRAYCAQNGEFTRSTTDFYAALEFSGFERKKSNKGVFVKGIRLKSEFLS